MRLTLGALFVLCSGASCPAFADDLAAPPSAVHDAPAPVVPATTAAPGELATPATPVAPATPAAPATPVTPPAFPPP
jgi:hypothetical protein